MSISSAMNTGVAGLFANSEAVQRISENIANANTVGYKRSFAQMVTTTTGGGDSASGVNAHVVKEVSNGGNLMATETGTDLAISGDGFFVVSPNSENTAVSDYSLTRAGSFRPDAEGYLVNSAGQYLSGYRYDQAGDLPIRDQSSFGQLETINVTNIALSAEPTSAMSVTGNLPSQETGAATPGAPFVSSSKFYTPLGNETRLSLSWQPTATADRWDLSISDETGATYGQVTVDFHDSGATAGAPALYSGATSLATAPAGFAFDTATGTATLTIDNGAVPQTISLGLGTPDSFEGVTQFAGDFTPQEFTVDGSPVSNVARTEIDKAGDVYAVYENGTRRAVYRIPLAMVTNPDGLTTGDGNTWQLSRDSGDLMLMDANTGGAGALRSSNLEGSNVDIAQELTDMIQVQRAYSSNAKIITTADDMLEETTRLKR